MRIGIDARLWGQGGLGRYIEQLVFQLEKIDSKNEYVVFLKKENFDVFSPLNKNFSKVVADFHWYGLSEQLLFPFFIKKQKLDLIHFPHFNVSIFCPVPFVVTIHDLILLKHPSSHVTTLGPWKYRMKKIGYSIVLRAALRKAKKIITVSNFTKEELLKTFRFLGLEKIVVIYEGVTALPFTHTKLSTFDKEKLFQYNIKKPYLLYVGNGYPHKNIEGLLLAFAALREKGKDLQLVLVWKEDYFYRRLKQQAKGLGLWGNSGEVDRVIFTGRVSNEILSLLYRSAELYVFPSFYEGFGLPPLEAMAHGLPVASSDIPALREILGDAPCYFHPEDPQHIEHAIEYLLKNREERKKCIERGFQQIKKYSWKGCAEETLKVYQEVLESERL